MNANHLPPNIQNTITSYLREHLPELQAVYLFGSRASSQARADSDYDIALLTETAIPPETRFDLSTGLANALDCDVDLIDLRSAHTVLRSQVISTGQRLHPINDDYAVEIFEDFVYSDYARLNEERAGILADIKEKGSVYGG